MGMGFAPTWLRQVSPPPLLHMTTLTTGHGGVRRDLLVHWQPTDSDSSVYSRTIHSLLTDGNSAAQLGAVLNSNKKWQRTGRNPVFGAFLPPYKVVLDVHVMKQQKT